MPLDNADIISQFPLLNRLSETGHKVIYLDSAATALKPQCVIDSMTDMLSKHTANIHRSVHFLGDEATELYENARHITAAFINAEANNIVFLRNTTEALNLIARCYKRDGRVLTSFAEHHSNYLTWEDNVHRLEVNSQGTVDMQALETELSKGDVSLVSLSHVSNVTGNIIDIRHVIELAHQYGAKVLIDAAQSAPHVSLDVEALDVDFLAFSGHKLGGPTGVGVLYGKSDLLEEMDAFHKGGSTIEEVTLTGAQEKHGPWRFEAGTPAIESVVGLASALEFLMDIGMERVEEIFSQLSSYTHRKIVEHLPEGCLIGEQNESKNGPFSLYFKGISPHVIARGMSDRYGICVRSGFHCAQPLHLKINVPATLRISFWIYNTEEEIDQAIQGIAQLIELVDH